MTAQETKLHWVRLAVLALVALALGVLAAVTVGRHDRTTRATRLELEKQRSALQREQQQARLVAGVLEQYLAMPETEWARRDQALSLVEQRAPDKALGEWAGARRKEIAPYLKRIRLVQRYNMASDRISVTPVSGAPRASGAPPAEQQADKPPPAKGSTRFADEGSQLAQARKSPHWKTYIKTREQLRLKRGRYCCRITTGRELFSKASSVGECRGYAQLLCDQLAKTVEEEEKGRKQKCFYALATACVGGEIIGAGDVDSAQ